jgi:two-component system NtrC family sensor kinase
MPKSMTPADAHGMTMPKSDMILIAIAEEQNQHLFESALGAASYQVAVSRDQAALDRALQELSPALVILGQDFGKGGGLRLAGAILERFPTMPVLLYFPVEDPALLKKAIRIGVSDCLFAPLRVDDIMHTVENSIQRANRLGDWTRREVKRTTASLQQRVDELQKFDTIINTIEDGVILIDQKQRVLMINLAVRRAFGILKEDELTGKPLLDVIPHPELRALVTSGGEGTLHNEISFDDGRVLSAQYTPIPTIGVAITLQDITYLKQIDRLKSEFVSTVSHDLRSPLTAILGYIDLLDRIGPLNEQQHEYTQRVKLSVQTITALVNDLLELGRIEAGLDIQKELVPLEGLLKYTVETFNSTISDKKLVLKLDIPAELPLIRGNPIRLRQMLDNLIGNAIKYTPETGRIQISLEAQKEQMILRIADTGPGIPPADQPHIFEKFYRASNVPKGVGGSGLGLAIVKSIVDNHHGRIWVESVLGKGATFTVVLPVSASSMKTT